MRSSLSAGLDLAKGLALGWSVPLIGVHHMQAHALTPRLVDALDRAKGHGRGNGALQAPSFPFLTLLASGGHTLLLKSNSTTSHSLLASTSDAPVGNCLDQIARMALPDDLLSSASDSSYGKLLEDFAFPSTQGTPSRPEYDYVVPQSRKDELRQRVTEWGWGIPMPFAQKIYESKDDIMEFSFSGIQSTAERIVRTGRANAGDGPPLREPDAMGLAERRALAREAMRVTFEHIAGRVVAALRQGGDGISTIVLSGGVAANKFLRHMLVSPCVLTPGGDGRLTFSSLRFFLDARGYQQVQLSIPPPRLCTDNAAMIAWAGVEMWEAGWESDLGCLPLKKWGLDESGHDGGVLGVSGWRRRAESRKVAPERKAAAAR